MVEKSRVEFIPIDSIDIIFRDRVFIDKNAPEENPGIRALAASIKKRGGLIHPIIVRELPNNRYEKLAGTRRILATKLLGEEMIESKIIPASMSISTLEAYSITLDENVERQDLDAISLIETYLSLLCIQVDQRLDKTIDIIDNDKLVEQGKKYFYKFEHTQNVLKKEGGYQNVTTEQSKIYHGVQDFLDSINISHSTFKKKLTLLGFDFFLKDLLFGNYVNVTTAKKLHSISIASPRTFDEIRSRISKIFNGIDDGEIDSDVAKEDINKVLDSYFDVFKFGSVERADYVKRVDKRLKIIGVRINEKHLDEDEQKQINKRLKEIEDILKEESSNV